MLSTANQFAGLVMNVLSLNFVTSIDDTLYEALLPITFCKEVEAVNFKRKYPAQQYMEASIRRKWLGQAANIFWVTGIVLWMFLYGECLSTVLPGSLSEVGEHCKEYISVKIQPHCLSMAW